MNTIVHVKEANRLAHIKYNEAWRTYDRSTGGTPQAAFYMWYTSQGMERQTGYVLVTDRGGRWARTKKELYKYINQ